MKGTAITAEELVSRLRAAVPDLIELVLSQPRRGIPNSTTESLRKITARPIEMKDGQRIQFTLQFEKRQTHENLDLDAVPQRCLQLLQHQFEHLHFYTRKEDLAIRVQRDGTFSWRSSRSTKVQTLEVVSVSHNRTKQYLIPENVPCRFLFEIGVMNRDGHVLAAKRQKFRQINRFLELVNDVLPHLPSDREIQVVDFGSGKSYLTFALHHLLTEIHRRPARIRGVDLKADVIQNCSRIARELQCDGLSFHHGDIAEFSEVGQVDMMVSLHACDTATDAALSQAVRWGTPVVLAVPCCQHELAANLDPDSALVALTMHGILKERFAALATDALRVNLLEICGYQTQIIEFIDLEHTPKNLLIRAVRRQNALGPAQQRELRKRFDDFKTLLHLEPPCLERLLQDLLSERLAVQTSREAREP